MQNKVPFALFLIPMRGNEILIPRHKGRPKPIFLIPMRGNEFAKIACFGAEWGEFLIPMRGNESGVGSFGISRSL